MERQADFELNELKNTIIKDKKHHMLIQGAPGSGKTYTYANRVAYLHQEEGVSGKEMLNLYMNKAAAQRMKTFYQDIDQSEEIEFLSLYVFAYRIIKDYNTKKGKTTRKLARDLSSLLQRVANQKFNKILREPQLRDIIQQMAYAKVMLLKQEDIEKIEVEGISLSLWLKVYDYEKRRRQVMDFEDIIVEALQILQEQPTICEAYRNQYRFIHVGQGEDLSYAAQLLLRTLLHDDMQMVIFSDTCTHRHAYGACTMGVDDFEQAYPNGIVYQLNTSYTLSKERCDAIQKIIPDMSNIDGQGNVENDIICKGFKDMHRMYAYAIKQSTLLPSITFTYADSAYALPLLDELEQQGLSYACHDNIHRFFQDPIVLELVSLIRLLLHPKETVYFIQAHTALPLDITKRILEEVCKAMEEEEMDVFEALIRSSLKISRKKELMAQMELIRMLPYKDTSFILESLLKSLDYKNRLKQLRVTKYDSNFLVFTYLCQKYSDPNTFVIRMDELASMTFSHHGQIDVLPLTQIKDNFYDHVMVLDCIEHHFPNPKATKAYQQDEKSMIVNALTHGTTLELFGFKSVAHIPCAISSFVFQIHNKKEETKRTIIKTASSNSIQKVSETHLKPKTRILHETLGEGVIKKTSDGMMEVHFDSKEVRNLNMKFCLNNDLIKIL